MTRWDPHHVFACSRVLHQVGGRSLSSPWRLQRSKHTSQLPPVQNLYNEHEHTPLQTSSSEKADTHPYDPPFIPVFPQDNIFLQINSHPCNPPGSSPIPIPSPSSSPGPTRFFPSSTEVKTKGARGQHTLGHCCPPQARRTVHERSQRISLSSAGWSLGPLLRTWWQGRLRVVPPHLH